MLYGIGRHSQSKREIEFVHGQLSNIVFRRVGGNLRGFLRTWIFFDAVPTPDQQYICL